MTSNLSDILLPRSAWSTVEGRSRAAAFVPITLALFGVAAILFGGVSARMDATAHAAVTDIDPVITGSIQPPLTDDERRNALRMLDR